MTEVTDPAILAQLNAPTEVTDLALLAKLNAPSDQNNPSSLFPIDAPNTDYGSVLPLARNTTTGEISFAAPEMIRSPARGILSLMGRAGGTQQPATEDTPNPSQSLTQDELGALMLVSPTSAATNAPNIVRSAADTVGMMAKPTAKVIGQTAGDLYNGTYAPMKSPPPLTLAEQAAKQKATSSAGYTAQPNITYSPVDQQSIGERLTALAPNAPATSLVSKGWNNSAAGKHVADIVDSLNAGPVTFEDLLAKRTEINADWAAAKARPGGANEARKLNQVEDVLTQAMTTPDTVDWLQANHDAAIAAIKTDFSKGMAKAAGKAQPGNAADNFINNYMNSYKGGLLHDSESDILNQIRSNSYTDEVKKSMASRLMSYTATGVGTAAGSLLGHPVPGAIVGDLLGTTLSKGARDAIFKEKAAGIQEFFDALDKRQRPELPIATPPVSLPPSLSTIIPKKGK